MTLRNLQQQLLATIVASEATECDFLALDKQAERISIYRNNTLGARFSGLQQIFPCAEKLLGTDYFQQLLEQFLQQAPSTHWRIEFSAAGFIAFVAQHDVLSYVPYLVDMLRFEQAWYQAFHAKPVTITPFSATASLQLASSVQLLQSDYPLPDIWSMCQPEYQGDFELKDTQEQAYLALVPRAEVEIVILNQLTWRILQRLSQKTRVSELQKSFSLTENEIETQLLETGLAQCFAP